MLRVVPVVLLVACGSARGDVLPPGTKWANHQVRVENAAAFPDLVFFVYPRDLGRGNPGNSSVRLSPTGEASMGGNPLARAKTGGVFLYAIPKAMLAKDDVPKDEWFENDTPGVLKAELRSEIRSVSIADKRSVFWTVYRAAVADGKLTLTEVSHDSPGIALPAAGDGPGAEPEPEKRQKWVAIGLAATGVVIAVGWLVLRRRPA